MSNQETILVAEDEPAVQKMIVRYLELAGYRVLAASDGKKALEIIKHEHLDLALIDLMLPEVDGWKLCHALKTDPNHKRTRVVILSALVRGDDTADKMDECDFLLSKPFQHKVLLSKIRELLDESRRIG